MTMILHLQESKTQLKKKNFLNSANKKDTLEAPPPDTPGHVKISNICI